MQRTIGIATRDCPRPGGTGYAFRKGNVVKVNVAENGYRVRHDYGPTVDMDSATLGEYVEFPQGAATDAEVAEALAAYVECALWSSDDESDDSGGEPLDHNHSDDDIAPEAMEAMREDVAEFVRLTRQLLLTWRSRWRDGTTPMQQAGHDLWLTRNGHGCGFWEDKWGSVGKRLTEFAEAMGQAYLYVGDDGRIYCD